MRKITRKTAYNLIFNALDEKKPLQREELIQLLIFFNQTPKKRPKNPVEWVTTFLPRKNGGSWSKHEYIHVVGNKIIATDNYHIGIVPNLNSEKNGAYSHVGSGKLIRRNEKTFQYNSEEDLIRRCRTKKYKKMEIQILELKTLKSSKNSYAKIGERYYRQRFFQFLTEDTRYHQDEDGKLFAIDKMGISTLFAVAMPIDLSSEDMTKAIYC